MKYFIQIFIALNSLSCYAQQIPAPATLSKNFDGIYLGVQAGFQNVFGGSFVNEMDILAQESKFVSEFALGYRKQFFHNRFVAGLDVSAGFLNGDLAHKDEVEQLQIDYSTRFQHSIGLQGGTVLGKSQRLLLFAYVNETKRKFDVAIQQRQYTFEQTDKQGMLKYGVGTEWQVFNRLHVRATFGALRVDFGELETNIDVEDKFDYNLGFVFQF